MRSPRCFSASTTFTVPSTAGPSSSLVSSKRDRARVVGLLRDEILGRDDEGGDRGLHVGGAAAVELAVADRRHERIGVPLLERAGGHDVGVAGEADAAGCAVPRRAHRLVTSPKLIGSHLKPAARSRSAISSWQPPSSGVTDLRAISSFASSSALSSGIHVDLEVAEGGAGAGRDSRPSFFSSLAGRRSCPRPAWPAGRSGR